ncbi:YciI family protein [Actinokineospora sp. HUAS TT18]|uniref:YciI family protein n=1 Tax=Actinokineospora sp. HUAS TT18 TaxID=3447451 RepID=UPI003F51BA9C
MKYLLSIYANPANWEALPEAERDGLMAEYGKFTQEIAESGELVDGAPLGDPTTANTVRVRAGQADVVDGPFAETKEHLAGYYIVECASQERAVELAAKIPDARYNAVEVRAVLDMGGQEM